jgi:hypothetical protein
MSSMVPTSLDSKEKKVHDITSLAWKPLLLCEESLEVQPIVDKELVSGVPVPWAKDSG